MELTKNYLIYKINDLSEVDTDNIITKQQSQNEKIIINLFNFEQLNYFNLSNLLEKNDIHLSIVCSKQIFQMLNINNILNKSLLKSISVDDLQITINIYLCNQIDEKILSNNIKVAETIKYIRADYGIKSKIHEVLYHANTILKNYKKQDNQVIALKNKFETLNSFVKNL